MFWVTSEIRDSRNAWPRDASRLCWCYDVTWDPKEGQGPSKAADRGPPPVWGRGRTLGAQLLPAHFQGCLVGLRTSSGAWITKTELLRRVVSSLQIPH